MNPKLPTQAYGILQRHSAATAIDAAVEQVRNLGYALVDSELSKDDLEHLSKEFDAIQHEYAAFHDRSFLRSIDEQNNIRLMLLYRDNAFLKVAMNESLLRVIGQLIAGKFVLNQQNGILNPPNENYNQGAWHRDLPYQHFVSSTPLAVNALFCIDDFTTENGATFVLPASHKAAAFPSAGYIERNAVQVQAMAGQFILLDCMAFHSGGYNATQRVRRAVNHVFSIPYFKQQINIPKNLDGSRLGAAEREILGYEFMEPGTVSEYFASRRK
ncbi:MAG: phytanoyl-CoA dioxygenase family protein [Variovorax sp.]